jgi:hypothetical protein
MGRLAIKCFGCGGPHRKVECPNRMLPGQSVPLCGDCGPGHVVQNCPLRNPPTLKTGLVALVNLMRVIPNPDISICRPSKISKMIQEEVYVVTWAQKAQVSIHKSQSAEPGNSSP